MRHPIEKAIVHPNYLDYAKSRTICLYCQNCYQSVKDEDNFCRRCGVQLKDEDKLTKAKVKEFIEDTDW